MFQKSQRATNVAQLFDDWTVLAGRGGCKLKKIPSRAMVGHVWSSRAKFTSLGPLFEKRCPIGSASKYRGLDNS